MVVTCKTRTGIRRNFLTMMGKWSGTHYLLEMGEVRKLITVKMFLLLLWMC